MASFAYKDFILIFFVFWDFVHLDFSFTARGATRALDADVRTVLCRGREPPEVRMVLGAYTLPMRNCGAVHCLQGY